MLAAQRQAQFAHPISSRKESNMAAKKILQLVGDFVEDYEVMVPSIPPSGRKSKRRAVNGSLCRWIRPS
jgi:hypothetical protein